MSLCVCVSPCALCPSNRVPSLPAGSLPAVSPARCPGSCITSSIALAVAIPVPQFPHPSGIPWAHLPHLPTTKLLLGSPEGRCPCSLHGGEAISPGMPRETPLVLPAIQRGEALPGALGGVPIPAGVFPPPQTPHDRTPQNRLYNYGHRTPRRKEGGWVGASGAVGWAWGWRCPQALCPQRGCAQPRRPTPGS